jgi:oxygen-independent coproporphyrinogen-3 oxidase
LRPEHLSLYSLTLESGTRLTRQVSEGLLPAPDEDLAADLYLQACCRLDSAGYCHYEISNWALGETRSDWDQPALACQHNLRYWRNGSYLGFGAGAHSSFDGSRFWNVRRPDAYVERIMEDASPKAGSEQIGVGLAMGETMMLGLRLIREGVADADFQRRFDRSLSGAFGREMSDLQHLGLLIRQPDRVRLSPRGGLLGNLVFARFLPA